MVEWNDLLSNKPFKHIYKNIYYVELHEIKLKNREKKNQNIDIL